MKVGGAVLLGVGVLAFALAVRATLNALQDGGHVGRTSSERPVEALGPQSQHEYARPSPFRGTVQTVHARSAAPKLFYAWNEALPLGYKCSAADGYVYKASELPDGSTGIEILQRDGHAVRCGGDGQSSHRY